MAPSCCSCLIGDRTIKNETKRVDELVILFRTGRAVLPRLHHFYLTAPPFSHMIDMRKNTKKFVIIKCSGCDLEYQKEKKEYDRQVRKGREKFYCTLQCGSANNKRTELTPFNGFLTHVRKNAALREIEFDLTVENLKNLWDGQVGKCPYTGLEMRLAPAWRQRKFSPYSVSLDRIDSSKGYVAGNIEFVCLAVNYAKNRFSQEEIKQFFDAVKNN